MKQIIKKNQFIITALAIMIAIAGYLNYAQKNGAENQYLAVNNMENDDKINVMDISDEDILAENQALNQAVSKENNIDVADNEIEGQEDVLNDINSLDLDLENTANEAKDTILNNGTNSLEMITEIKLNREQVRAQNKEVLMGIINNEGLSEEQKQNAVNELIASTAISEKEAAAERLLEAKGFKDVVVSITDDTVDVVVNMSELSDADRAQIEDIVKRKTEMVAEKIVITPVMGEK
ncbi:MAG: SpoIIIAH-like family protein [Lachnospiraceae bacterium]|nr:SpoIIIAH-like family protein [Lachnospiraceae bacterium]